MSAAATVSPQLSPTHLPIAGRQPTYFTKSCDHRGVRSCDPVTKSCDQDVWSCEQEEEQVTFEKMRSSQPPTCPRLVYDGRRKPLSERRCSEPTTLEYRPPLSAMPGFQQHSDSTDSYTVNSQDHNHYLLPRSNLVARDTDFHGNGHINHSEEQNGNNIDNTIPCDSSSNSAESSPDSQMVLVPSPPGLHGNISTNRRSRCEALEQKHVHDVYEKTAHHFERIRFKAWPKVRQFIQELDEGSLVADVGCGQGKYLHINKSLYKVGSDRSTRLVDIAHNNHHETMVCDNLHLPYRDGCFDAVISIGVIHHMTTGGRRAAAVAELARVLRPGGRVMIYVWAMEQKQRKFKSQDVLVPWHLKPKHNKKDIIENGEGSDTEQDPPIRSHKSRSHQRKSQELGHSDRKCLPDARREALKNAAKQRSKSASSPLKSHKQLVSPSLSLVESDLAAYSAENMENNLKQPSKSPSIPSLIKLHILSLFGSSPVKESLKQKDEERKVREEKIKAEYRDLFEQILKEDFEKFRRHKPMLEHSLSAPESEVFAVREFPQSSRPKLEKHLSLDNKPSNHNAHISAHAAAREESYRPVSFFHNGPTQQHSRHNGFSALDSGTCVSVEEEETQEYNSVNASPESEYVFSDSPDNSITASCQSSTTTTNGAISDDISKSAGAKSATFTVGEAGCSDSEGESWVQATTQAIRTVESRVERLTSSQRYYMYGKYSGLPSQRQENVVEEGGRIGGLPSQTEEDFVPGGSNGENVEGDYNLNGRLGGKSHVDIVDRVPNGKMNGGRNGGMCLDHPRVKKLSQSRLSCSSVSSFSSDTGTYSESETDDLGSLFDTDTEVKKGEKEEEEEDEVFENAKNDNERSANESSPNNNADAIFAKMVPKVNNINDPKVAKSDNVDESDVQEAGREGQEEGNESFKRFYHVFREGELDELISKHVECLHVIDSYYDHANWCVVAEKVRVWTI